MRIQKWIAQCGLMSRRKAEEAIQAGRVKLNGVVVQEMGTTLDPIRDRVEVDDELVQAVHHRRTFLFYKPRGVITTKSDDRGRKTVMDFFPDILSLNPVGRLDFESEGLLLMTHDGDLALRLTHPRYEIQKVYEVVLNQTLTPENIENLLAGVELDDGMGRFLSVSPKPYIETEVNQFVASPLFHTASYEITVSEGRNRFLRRMLAKVGCAVLRLRRIKMGDFYLSDLKPGERREYFGSE